MNSPGCFFLCLNMLYLTRTVAAHGRHAVTAELKSAKSRLLSPPDLHLEFTRRATRDPRPALVCLGGGGVPGAQTLPTVTEPPEGRRKHKQMPTYAAYMRSTLAQPTYHV